MIFNNYEDYFLKEGYKSIAGIDEVGKGCLFGDVVACAKLCQEENLLKV